MMFEPCFIIEEKCLVTWLGQVLKSDVEAALQVLNFAIYHQELNEMEEREQERQREMEREHGADHDATDNTGRSVGRNGTSNRGSTSARG